MRSLYSVTSSPPGNNYIGEPQHNTMLLYCVELATVSSAGRNWVSRKLWSHNICLVTCFTTPDNKTITCLQKLVSQLTVSKH